MTTKPPYSIVVDAPGGPDQFRVRPIDIPEPPAGFVLVRNTAVGLNYIDTYHRSGLYPQTMPLVIGMEGAGVVEALGEGVTNIQSGDRVAYVDPIGAYATHVLRPASRVVTIPDGISDELAAAAMLKGITAHYLLHSTYAIGTDDIIVVHAAAGGVGQILCQWATAKGATVIGTVGSPKKVAIAKLAGCRYVIDTSSQTLAETVRELTGGKGVPVVYDGVGKATFLASLDCLQARGLMVSFGNASGVIDTFNPALLAAKGSLYLTRPALNTYIASTEELHWRAGDVFAAINEGALTININARYPLSHAALAHSDLEARKTLGSALLIP